MPAKVRNPPKWQSAELHLPACGGCGIGCRTHRLVGSTRGLRCVPNLRGCNTTGGEAAGIPTDDWRLWNLDCRQVPARSVRPPGPAALQSQIHTLKSAIPKSPQRRGKGWERAGHAACRACLGTVSIPSEAGQGLGGDAGAVLREVQSTGFNPLRGGARVGRLLHNLARSGSQRGIGYPLFAFSANRTLSTCYPQTRHSSPKSSHGTSAPFWALCRQSANLPPFWGCWRFADAESARSGA